MRYRTGLLIAIMLTAVLTAVAAGKKFTLVIDAGHGGNDTGAVGAISKEKNINLSVALAFGRYVERNCPDVRVIYTRTTDVFIPLHQRADIANRNKADLFISIHTNSLPGGRIARGLETYTLGMHRAADNLDVAKRENAVILIEKDYKQRYEGFDPNSAESYIMFEFMQDKNMAQSVELARYVQNRVCASAGRPNKGVKQAGFLVLRETSMPSCLIELGFISTPDEERFLNTAGGVDQLGKGIYLAFLDYKKKYDKSITVPYKAETQPSVNIPALVPPAENPPAAKAGKKGKRKREIQQELADARTGAAVAEPSAPAAPADADSVVAAVPQAPAAPATPVEQPAPEGQPAASVSTAAPVFKVQILASSTRLAANSPQLHGQQQTEFYQEGGYYKYTVGSSENYQEIYQLRKTLLDKFPQAFIIAFRDGQKMDVREAIREFKERKNR